MNTVFVPPTLTDLAEITDKIVFFLLRRGLDRGEHLHNRVSVIVFLLNLVELILTLMV